MTDEESSNGGTKMTMSNARQNSAIALAVSSILAGATGVARAETAAALEEIVVTATRRDQAVLEIPFNISAVSGQVLDRGIITDAVEALRTVPGVTMQDRGFRNAGVAAGIVMRGINVDNGTNGDVPLAAAPTVTTYVNDTAVYGAFILKDIERIEVLRGPQGTLYGSGSLAGTVRYIMRKPDTEDFSGEASVNFGMTEGSDGYNFNPDLMLNIPASDTLAFRVNLGMIDNDGIVDYPNVYAKDGNGDPIIGDALGTPVIDPVNCTTPTSDPVLCNGPVYRKVEDVDSVDIKYARGSALFEPSDSFSALLSFQWQDDEVGGRRQVTRGENIATGGEYDDYEFGAVQLEPSERTVQLAALEMEFGLGFATLTSSTSYYEHDGTGISDNSGVYARNGWFRFYGSSPRPIAQAERFYDDSAFTQEFRLVSKGGQFIDWAAGAFYVDQDYDLGQNSYLPGYLPYLNHPEIQQCGAPCTTNQDFLFRRNQSYEEIALFGEATVNFTDDLHLTLGGRYFDNSLDVDAFLDIPIYSSPTNPPGTASESIDDDDFLAKVNFAWDMTDDLMLYATFSQGYRHAGANAVPTSGTYGENPAYLTFNSDSVDNYEVGFKGMTDWFTYSASVYYADWKDPQLNTSTPNWGFFAVVNGESASTQGIELELSGRFTDEFSYSLGYTYTDAELTDDLIVPAGNFYDGPTYTDLVARDGDRLPGTPEHMFSVSFGYDTELSNGFGLSAVLNGYYQSDSLNALGDANCLSGEFRVWGLCRDSANPDSAFYQPESVYNRSVADIDSFQIWNASATLSWDQWQASLYVKNLFNDDGTTGVATFLAQGSSPEETQRYFGNNSRDFIALPRTIGIVLGYKF
jgi:iron complex outermembrane receptor protein